MSEVSLPWKSNKNRILMRELGMQFRNNRRTMKSNLQSFVFWPKAAVTFCNRVSVFVCLCCSGAALAVHIPFGGVHWHGNHLQHHPSSGDRAADHAHTEVLLLGCEPCPHQRHHTQRPGSVHTHTHTHMLAVQYGVAGGSVQPAVLIAVWTDGAHDTEPRRPKVGRDSSGGADVPYCPVCYCSSWSWSGERGARERHDPCAVI